MVVFYLISSLVLHRQMCPFHGETAHLCHPCLLTLKQAAPNKAALMCGESALPPKFTNT